MAKSHKKSNTATKSNSKNPSKEISKAPTVTTIVEDDEDINSGFGSYLRSGEGNFV